ncbi:hypothetical protein [Flavobacterium sangjuense]|uniref:Uncharacterized protein n=1 Tax=Flavobacterium sangjuense TaxID=2518177 RepID=A0A4P7PVN9_9FLAO|nr:hypothetical protein [Flavobacterium sangjuense]QBZ98856.1 hypothetical protein GS03_02368 [Flavobacterium sangjuense]
MIDIRTIEIVTPDIQRQALIESNNKLKNLSFVLVLFIGIGAVAFCLNYLNQQRSKEK